MNKLQKALANNESVNGIKGYYKLDAVYVPIVVQSIEWENKHPRIKATPKGGLGTFSVDPSGFLDNLTKAKTELENKTKRCERREMLKYTRSRGYNSGQLKVTILRHTKDLWEKLDTKQKEKVKEALIMEKIYPESRAQDMLEDSKWLNGRSKDQLSIVALLCANLICGLAIDEKDN